MFNRSKQRRFFLDVLTELDFYTIPNAWGYKGFKISNIVGIIPCAFIIAHGRSFVCLNII